MTPLDLTQQPPRSCRDPLGDVLYLARAIDKVRAELPGGSAGDYMILHPEIATMSKLFYKRLGITHDDFVAAVASAATDDDVVAWLRSHTEPEKIASWNAQVPTMRIIDIPEPIRTQVRNNHPGAAHLPDETAIIDMFDADDAAAFART
jgi:hypothetical protein